MPRGLDDLKARLNFRGGGVQEHRMQYDKLRSLKSALLYSYQAETLVLEDGRAFRCLINEDKLKGDYDCKTLSIPYEDICVGKYDAETGEIVPKKPDGKTTGGIEKIGIKPGDVFLWKETNSYWIVTNESLEEDAYFMGEIYKCETTVNVKGKDYHIYVRGPVETTIQWYRQKKKYYNDMNYSLVCYITKNEDTLDYFHRFTQVTIDGNQWEVAVVNPFYGKGIIELNLIEWYNNEFAEAQSDASEGESDVLPSSGPRIEGPSVISALGSGHYNVIGLYGGRWGVSNGRLATIETTGTGEATVKIKTGKSGEVVLTYATDTDSVSLPIVIKSM